MVNWMEGAGQGEMAGKKVKVKDLDQMVDRDHGIEDLMKPVAQVAMMRLDGLAGLGDDAWNRAAESIFLGARSGRLRVRGMAHPENGKLVHELRSLEEIGEPLRVDAGPAGGAKGLAVPDVYFVRSRESWLMPWDASSGGQDRVAGDGRRLEDFCCVTGITRDGEGRVASKEEFLDEPVLWSYGYDRAGRLARVMKNGSLVERYGYDAKARRSSDWSLLKRSGERHYRYADDDRLLEAGPVAMRYDEHGALAEKGAGKEDALLFEHDRSRVAVVYLPGGRKIEYVHDEDGCRVERRVNGRTMWQYAWLDQTRLASVRDVERGIEVSMEYGEDGQGMSRAPLRMLVNHGQGGSVRQYDLVCDLRGSLRGVRNEDGKLVKIVEYDSFGNVTRDEGFGEGENMFVPLGYAGGLPDPDHNLVHFAFRDYDPDTGRWTAKDPLGLAGGDEDLYGYCLDDPVNWIDPLGLLRKGVEKRSHGGIKSFPKRTSLGSFPVMKSLNRDHRFRAPNRAWIAGRGVEDKTMGSMGPVYGLKGSPLVKTKNDALTFLRDPNDCDEVRSELNRLGNLCTYGLRMGMDPLQDACSEYQRWLPRNNDCDKADTLDSLVDQYIFSPIQEGILRYLVR